MSSQHCDCQDATVGEFLLSRGIEQVDSKQLAAGERLHTICQAHQSKSLEERDMKWEASVKVIDEKWHTMQESLTNVSTTYQRESQFTLQQVETFKQEVLDTMARAERASTEERCLMGDEIRKMHTQLMEVKEAEITGLLLRIETLQQNFTSSEQQTKEVTERLNLNCVETDGLRSKLAEVEAQKTQLTETFGQERSRNAAIVEQLKGECQILSRAVAEASESVEQKKKQHSAAMHELNSIVTKTNEELNDYKHSLRHAESLRDEADQLLICKTQETNILRVQHESHTMDLKAQLADLNKQLNARNVELEDVVADCKRYNEQGEAMSQERSALEAALEAANTNMKAVKEEHANALETLRKENAELEKANRECTSTLTRVEVELAAAQGQTLTLTKENTKLAATMRDEKEVMSRQINECKPQLEQLAGQLEILKSAKEAEEARYEQMKTDKLIAEEALAKCRFEGGEQQKEANLMGNRILELEQQVQENEKEFADWHKENLVAQKKEEVSDAKLEEITLYARELEQAIETCKQQNTGQEEINAELVTELKGLRLELREVKEERDALKELVTIGRYDAMDSLLRTTKPCITEEEAEEMHKEIEEGKTTTQILSQAVGHMHVNCLKAQEVLEGFLACLPAVPPLEDIDYFRLEDINGQYTALLRDTVRAHIEGKKREEASPPPPENPLSVTREVRVAKDVQPEPTGHVGRGVALTTHAPSATAITVPPERDAPYAHATASSLSTLAATAIDPSPSTFLTNVSTLTAPPEKPKQRSSVQAHTKSVRTTNVSNQSSMSRVSTTRKPASPKPPIPANNLVRFGGLYSVPELAVSPRRR
eukprot:TRINITY_DN5188_c0_g1_i1.p1 TRINITY_DN5188_c0_g1~~TRINITY_DN5188_c0_g1_i1.p1  ORF type:complete len:832 (+),score=204.20 TRINITY_DN5188_c0_g1_i1:3380-5875(+)